MANTILHKKNSSTGVAPTTGQLELGEIAINTFDGKLFIKKDDGAEAIVEIGGGGGAISPLTADLDTGGYSIITADGTAGYGNADSITIKGGDGDTPGTFGRTPGAVTIEGGSTFGALTVAGGPVTLQGGSAATGSPGKVSILGGHGNHKTGEAGDIDIIAGNNNYLSTHTYAGQYGGNVLIQGGYPNLNNVNATGGSVTLKPGRGGATAGPGAIQIASADGAGYASFDVLDDVGSYKTTVGVASLSADTVFTLPDTDGTSGQVLTAQGSGVTAWATASGGGAANEITFTFSTATSGTPAAGVVRIGTTSMATTTSLTINDISLQGLDIGSMLGNLSIGDQIYVKQSDADANYGFYIVDGEPVDNTGFWTIPVQASDSGVRPDDASTVGIIKMPGRSMGRDPLGNIMAGTGTPVALGGGENIVIGNNAGSDMSSSLALSNTIIGHDAGRSLVSGDRNVIIGVDACGDAATTNGGSDYVFIGRGAGQNAQCSSLGSLAIGRFAGKAESGFENTIVGAYSGHQTTQTSGSTRNVIFGARSGAGITNGDYNTVIGPHAGNSITTGSGNVCIGKFAGPTINTGLSQLYINSATAASNTPLIHGIFDSGSEEVTINGDFKVTGEAHLGNLAFNAQTGTTYTLVIGDAGEMVTMSNAAANTLTIPTNASVAFPIGTQILVEQEGAGTTTIAGPGVTLHSAGSLLSLSSQYSTVTLIKKATDTWLIAGDLA